jgi:hypothetical protein
MAVAAFSEETIKQRLPEKVVRVASYDYHAMMVLRKRFVKTSMLFF